MAQSGFTPIQLYYSATTTNVPLAANLAAGELAINTADGKLFYKDSSGVVQVIGTKGGVGSSSTTQVLYNSSGLVTGSASMTFDGSTLTTLNLAYTGVLTGGASVVNFGSGQFYKNASGNVGLGTTSPNSRLDVRFANLTSPTQLNHVLLQSLASGSTSQFGARTGITFSNCTTDYVTNTGLSTSGVYGIDLDADVFGRLMGLAFYTSTLDAAATEKMRIDSVGNVGIGTTSLSDKLVVYTGNAANANSGVSVTRGTVGTNGTVFGMRLKSDGSGIYRSALVSQSAANAELEVLTIAPATGYVGILNASPTAPLDVVGNIQSNGAYRITGSDSPSSGASAGLWQFYDIKDPDIGIYTYTLTMDSGNFGFAYSASTTPWDTSGTQHTFNYLGDVFHNGSVTAGKSIASQYAGSYDYTAVSSVLAGSPGSAGGFNTHMGLNVWWNGSVWKTGTDLASNGGALITSVYGNGDLTFHTMPSTGGTNQSITNANLGNYARMKVDAAGFVLVGTSAFSFTPNPGVILNPAGGVLIGNNAGTTGWAFSSFCRSGTQIGSITQSGTTAVLYNTTSDQRLKNNIQDATSASSLIDALQVRQFDWKTDGVHQRYGFVAQELVQVAPEAVHQPANPDDMMAVDYSKLVPMLVKEIQALRARMAALEAK